MRALLTLLRSWNGTWVLLWILFWLAAVGYFVIPTLLNITLPSMKL
jgi:hypothetical protein